MASAPPASSPCSIRGATGTTDFARPGQTNPLDLSALERVGASDPTIEYRELPEPGTGPLGLHRESERGPHRCHKKSPEPGQVRGEAGPGLRREVLLAGGRRPGHATPNR